MQLDQDALAKAEASAREHALRVAAEIRQALDSGKNYAEAAAQQIEHGADPISILIMLVALADVARQGVSMTGTCDTQVDEFAPAHGTLNAAVWLDDQKQEGGE